MEQKIRTVAQGLIKQSANDMNSKMNDRSKHLRDYMEVQIQKNEASRSRETSQNRKAPVMSKGPVNMSGSFQLGGSVSFDQ